MRMRRFTSWLRRVMTLAILLAPATALAEAAEQVRGGGMGRMDCMPMKMGGAWMGIGMAFAWLLGLATLAALIALTVFLVRHSRPARPV